MPKTDLAESKRGAMHIRERIRQLVRHPRVKPYASYAVRTLRRLSGKSVVRSSGKRTSAVTRAATATDDARSKTIHNILTQMAQAYPVSNGCRFYKKIPLRLAIVTDVYMFNFYRDCLDECIYVNPDNVDEVIEGGFDALCYVTCWSGIANDEWRGVKYRERPQQALEQLLEYCRRSGTPSIFHSIEDPSNYEYFLPIAQKFDFVFTSDIDCLDRYKHDLGHDRIYYGEYGVNPLLCNPIGIGRPAVNAAFFAGSYPSRYPDRCNDMNVMFESLRSSGADLIIADRNYGNTDTSVQFPEAYEGHIINRFDHEILQRVHKLFRYNLNFNSIKDSPTMCAMRVYELQAMGRGILSNYARSVFNRFPLIKIVPEQQNLSAYFARLAGSDWHEYRRNMDGVLNVMTSKTSFDIVGAMMKQVGLAKDPQPPGVAVIVDEITPEIEATFNRQSYANKHLVGADIAKQQHLWSQMQLEKNIRFFAFFEGSVDYTERYLDAMLNSFKYTTSRYVTKDAHFEGGRFVPGRQHEYTDVVAGKARSCFCAESFSPADFAHAEPFERFFEAGGYAVDPFEANEEEFFLSLREEKRGDFALSVVVPVFNNGEHLISKCIESLTGSACWNNLEILLIDDGSTDEATLAVCTRLSRYYSNVRTHFFPAGGSGSASRPRNKGIELASAPLVTFLDPDNEIAIGGYDLLLKLYHEQEEMGASVDFVSGYQVKVGRTNSKTGVHSRSRCSIAADPKETYFREGRFPVISSQAAVISRKFLLEKNLRFVEGAAGQDTLFGWQMLHEADRVAFTNGAFILYYFERAGSITNDIDVAYFEKKLTLEREQAKWLKQCALLNEYVDHHLDGFVRGWYLPKLEQVPSSEAARAREVLREILALYGAAPERYGL